MAATSGQALLDDQGRRLIYQDRAVLSNGSGDDCCCEPSMVRHMHFEQFSVNSQLSVRGSIRYTCFDHAVVMSGSTVEALAQNVTGNCGAAGKWVVVYKNCVPIAKWIAEHPSQGINDEAYYNVSVVPGDFVATRIHCDDITDLSGVTTVTPSFRTRYINDPETPAVFDPTLNVPYSNAYVVSPALPSIGFQCTPRHQDFTGTIPLHDGTMTKVSGEFVWRSPVNITNRDDLIQDELRLIRAAFVTLRDADGDGIVDPEEVITGPCVMELTRYSTDLNGGNRLPKWRGVRKLNPTTAGALCGTWGTIAGDYQQTAESAAWFCDFTDPYTIT